MTKKSAVYALTQQGAMLGADLASRLDADLYLPTSLAGNFSAIPFSGLPRLISETFSRYRSHVFITAVGIAVRCIAPHIQQKTHDPAVVAMDQRGNFVVSLLSGHLGGANTLTWDIAAFVGGAAVITTATDTENLPSLDVLALEIGLAIANIKAVTAVNAALLDKRPVFLHDPDNYLKLKDSAWAPLFRLLESPTCGPWEESPTSLEAGYPIPALVEVTCEAKAGGLRHLVLHPQCLHLGVGCRKNTAGSAILAFIRETMAEQGLAEASLASLSSASLKQSEQGIWDAGKALNLPLHFYPSEELATMPVTSPSKKAREVLGVDGVCEAAALLAAGTNARLRLPKRAWSGITLAIAEERPV